MAAARWRRSWSISARIIWSAGRGRPALAGNPRPARRKRPARSWRRGCRLGRHVPETIAFNTGTKFMRAFGVVMRRQRAHVACAPLGRKRPPAPGTCPTISNRSWRRDGDSGRSRREEHLALERYHVRPLRNAGQIFKKNILAEHPVILGLFSGAGGRFVLYRPGVAPLEAPSVPIDYQLLKSVGHSAMALSEVVVPYLDSPNELDLARRARLLPQPHAIRARRSRCRAHARRLEAGQPRHPAEQHRVHGRALKANAISPEALQAFAKKQGLC